MESLWQSQIHRILVDPLSFSEKITLYFHNQQFKCTRTVILDAQGYQELWKGEGIVRLVKVTKGHELDVKVYQMLKLNLEDNFANYITNNHMKFVANYIEEIWLSALMFFIYFIT